MNNELKYIFKGVLYTCLLLIITGFCYYAFANNKSGNHDKQPKAIITYNDLMNRTDVAAGKMLFDNKCSACHSIRKTDEFDFDKIVENDYDEETLFAFIRNSDSVIRSGNEYYNALFNEYSHVIMTSFPNLTDEEIDGIISYIKVEKTFENLPKK